MFNVRFHVVYNDDGVTRTNSNGVPGLTIGFEEVMNAIRDLNVNFNQFNIFFKYYGFDTINNTTFLNYGNTTSYGNMISTHNIPEAFNIYILNQVGGAAAVAGYYWPFSIFDDNWFIRPWTLCHEMGHSFGLLHTFFSSGECEHAVRTPTPLGTPFNLQYNADVAGDQIKDTFPFLSSTFSDNNCNYTGGATDCRGSIINSQTVNGFFITGSPSNNFMTTESEDILCNPSFTPEQGIRMRNAFNIVPERYDSKRNSIQSLYEPFERIKVLGAIKSVVDNNNGTATVCTYYSERFRFQKGFNYVFPENELPDLVNYNPYDLPDIQLPAFNCPLIIQQLGMQNGQYPIGNALTIDKGYICEIQQIIGGSDTITDDLGGYIFTVEEWDSLKASNPNFYELLESNKYHIIKKETEKGVMIQVVLYKN
ncbi:hypothetical protein [Flavobacterium sp.]|uniref:hypothetical protein n=1 Tax=Flavobacterium sp. TaxID=239 RepID=UPI00262B8997|nr:hypothetical protein [Flavobacterium sp.]